MAISNELQWRGLVKDMTFSDLSWLDKPQTFYLGVDCSADSLTIGNLAVFLMAKRLLENGWNGILLVGGATSLIGDPGGKTEERELKSRAEVKKNVEVVESQVRRLFKGKSFRLVDNYDWFSDIKYLEFLRDIGKHFSMSELLQREFVSERLGSEGAGISYAEFSYSLIQGYDYWHLFKKYGAVLQVGGSDQWGNMLSGVTLVRKLEGKEVHALSMPLVVNKATGTKFGKSEEGAIWLDEKKTSVFKFYQFWLNVDDDSVGDLLKIYTDITEKEIESLMREFEGEKAGRAAQKKLALEVTKIVHGEQAAKRQEEITNALFNTRKFHGFDKSKFAELESELPFVEVSEGETYFDALVKTGLATSKSEARRLIEQGGVSHSKELYEINSLETAISKSDTMGGYIVIFKGKKYPALLKVK